MPPNAQERIAAILAPLTAHSDNPPPNKIPSEHLHWLLILLILWLISRSGVNIEMNQGDNNHDTAKPSPTAPKDPQN